MSLSKSWGEWLRFIFATALTIVATGLGSWLFLMVLDAATDVRLRQPLWFLFAPLAGLLVGFGFHVWSPLSAGGNSILTAMLKNREDQADLLSRVPKPLAPLIVVGTWLGHLAGLSVGREGTAVQMGGGLASLIGRVLTVPPLYHRLLLRVGIASGFGSVFGVPLAGGVFAFEMNQLFHYRQLPKGRSQIFKAIRAIAASASLCFISSWGASEVAIYFGAHHGSYADLRVEELFTPMGLLGLLVLASLSGLLAWIFLFLLHHGKIRVAQVIRRDWLRPVIGGLIYTSMVVAPGWLLLSAGIGTNTIQNAFQRAMPFYEPFIKIAMTAFAIAFGFRGGEVTPLFFIGATAGSYLSGWFGLQPETLASLGLVAVFAAAGGVPLTCAVMAGELFGGHAFFVALPVCLWANWLCRHSRLFEKEI